MLIYRDYYGFLPLYFFFKRLYILPPKTCKCPLKGLAALK